MERLQTGNLSIVVRSGLNRTLKPVSVGTCRFFGGKGALTGVSSLLFAQIAGPSWQIFAFVSAIDSSRLKLSFSISSAYGSRTRVPALRGRIPPLVYQITLTESANGLARFCGCPYRVELLDNLTCACSHRRILHALPLMALPKSRTSRHSSGAGY
jgi:hypothetical protein